MYDSPDRLHNLAKKRPNLPRSLGDQSVLQNFNALSVASHICDIFVIEIPPGRFVEIPGACGFMIVDLLKRRSV